MKIKDIKIQVINRNIILNEGTDLSHEGVSFVDRFADVCIFTITTDDGIQGTSFGFSGKKTAPYLALVKPLLVGKDPLCREEIWHFIWGQSREQFYPQIVIGMIDVALWDIAGKATNLPIYKLLGAYREKVKAYVSTPMFSSLEEYIDKVQEYQARGFTALKLHIPFGPRKDIEVCRAVRKAAGDNMILMLDPIGAYDHREALMVGRELEKLNFYWYEEPVSDMDTTGLTKLRKKLDIPIAMQSAQPGNFYSRATRISEGAIDIIRGDVLYSEGITSLKKTAALAEAFGMKCEIHGLFDPIMNAANLHVTCAIKNCDFYEYIALDEVAEFGVKQGIKIDNEGYAHVPKAPGIGLEIDWDYINKCTVETL